jgi:hypothetical protein
MLLMNFKAIKRAENITENRPIGFHFPSLFIKENTKRKYNKNTNFRPKTLIMNFLFNLIFEETYFLYSPIKKI